MCDMSRWLSDLPTSLWCPLYCSAGIALVGVYDHYKGDHRVLLTTSAACAGVLYMGARHAVREPDSSPFVLKSNLLVTSFFAQSFLIHKSLKYLGLTGLSLAAMITPLKIYMDLVEKENQRLNNTATKRDYKQVIESISSSIMPTEEEQVCRELVEETPLISEVQKAEHVYEKRVGKLLKPVENDKLPVIEKVCNETVAENENDDEETVEREYDEIVKRVEQATGINELQSAEQKYNELVEKVEQKVEIMLNDFEGDHNDHDCKITIDVSPAAPFTDAEDLEPIYSK